MAQKRPELTVEDLIRETRFSTEYRTVFGAAGKATVLSGSPDRTWSSNLGKSLSAPGLKNAEPEKPTVKPGLRVSSNVGSTVPAEMLWKGLVLGGYRGPRMSLRPKSELSYPTDVWDEAHGKMMRSEYMLSFREQGPWGTAGVRGGVGEVSNRKLMADLAKERRAMELTGLMEDGSGEDLPPKLPGAVVPSTLQAFPPDEIRAFRATGGSRGETSSKEERTSATVQGDTSSGGLGGGGSPEAALSPKNRSAEAQRSQRRQKQAAMAVLRKQERELPGKKPTTSRPEPRSKEALAAWEKHLAEKEARLEKQRIDLEKWAQMIELEEA